MTPLRLTRQARPVEAVEVTEATLPDVRGWLAELGYDSEPHGDHLLLFLAGPIAVGWGDWITACGQRVEVWSASEFWGEHYEEGAA